MPDKKVTTTAKTADWTDVKVHGLIGRYYLELARMTTGLLIGVMALMTFLLTVGLQHPQKPFAAIFYTCVSLLVVSLLVFVMAQSASQMALTAETDAKVKSAQVWAKRMRMLQQALFILSILAVLALILISAHIFFAPPAASTGAAAASGQ